MKAKTLIVGGGVMGTSIAMHLAKHRDPLDEPVVLLEKSSLAAGSSGRSGAVLRQFYGDRVTAAMARDSLRFYSTLTSRLGRRIGFRKTGVITLVGPHQSELLTRLDSNLAMMREIGIEAEGVDAERIRELVPGATVEDGTRGVWEPTAGFIDPRRTVDALAGLARDYGAITRLGVRVTEFCVEEGRICGVQTQEGHVEAEQVVVAAGPWSHSLLERAGANLPLQAIRPEQHFIEMPVDGVELPPLEELDEDPDQPPEVASDPRFTVSTTIRRPIPHPVLLDLEHGYYTRCEPDLSRTRVGSIEYDGDAVVRDPDALEEACGPKFGAWSREKLVQRLPRYANQPDLATEAAMYTLTPDNQAVLGPIPGIEGLFVVGGFSGHGFKLAPSVGEGMTQMLLGMPVSAFDPAFFDPARFLGTKVDGTGTGGDFGI